jgi:hypothetical protein
MSLGLTMSATWRSSDHYASRSRRASRVAAGLSFCVALAYAIAIAATRGDLLLLAPLAGALLLVLVIARPVVGLYVLFAGALVLEQFDVPGISPITAQTRFFHNISAYTPIPLRLCIADLIMLLTLAACVVRHGRRREAPCLGPFAVPVALYVGVFAAGTAIGVLRGGAWDASATLAELRGPLYLGLLYFLTADLVRERLHLAVIVWSFALLVGAKALQGIANHLTAVGSSLSLEAVTGHEDVVFFNAAIALAIVALVVGVRTRMSFTLLAFTPAILLAELVTQRRVGFVGLAAVVIAVAILAFARHPRRGLALAALGLVAVGVYVPLFWDATGPIAQPIRALRVLLDDPTVTVRDQLSDQWRVIENRNIEYTMRQVPLTGVGLGQEYLFQQEPPRPSATFTYWRYMTHNALLWVWLKAGPIGAFALAYLVARVLLVSSALFGRLRDRELQLVAILPVALVIAQVVFSSVELGLTYSRTMIVLGVALGLTALLADAAPRGAKQASPSVGPA